MLRAQDSKQKGLGVAGGGRAQQDWDKGEQEWTGPTEGSSCCGRDVVWYRLFKYAFHRVSIFM